MSNTLSIERGEEIEEEEGEYFIRYELELDTIFMFSKKYNFELRIPFKEDFFDIENMKRECLENPFCIDSVIVLNEMLIKRFANRRIRLQNVIKYCFMNPIQKEKMKHFNNEYYHKHTRVLNRLTLRYNEKLKLIQKYNEHENEEDIFELGESESYEEKEKEYSNEETLEGLESETIIKENK